ncbi:hypothetical protein QJQ45_028326, partial [Haematococcus lacustris]
DTEGSEPGSSGGGAGPGAQAAAQVPPRCLPSSDEEPQWACGPDRAHARRPAGPAAARRGARLRGFVGCCQALHHTQRALAPGLALLLCALALLLLLLQMAVQLGCSLAVIQHFPAHPVHSQQGAGGPGQAAGGGVRVQRVGPGGQGSAPQEAFVERAVRPGNPAELGALLYAGSLCLRWHDQAAGWGLSLGASLYAVRHWVLPLLPAESSAHWSTPRHVLHECVALRCALKLGDVTLPVTLALKAVGLSELRWHRSEVGLPKVGPQNLLIPPGSTPPLIAMLRQDDLSPSGANASSSALDERFLKGVAISVWQSSGDEGTSNWSRFANFGRWPFGSIGVRTTWGKYKVGKSCDFWHRYREDMQLAKDIGCTAFRFSFEWARIEPERGRVDSAALDRYAEMLDCLAALGLEPCVTLHHFTHPLWFEDQGGFSQAANIPLFVEYCKVVFRTFGQRIRLWATFNEPTSHVFLAYVLGASPPGYLFNLLGEGRALGNMLRAHSAAYHALKAMPGGQRAQVGLVNHHITMVAHGGGLFRPLAKAIAPWAEYYMGWDVMDQWMRTGEFSWKLPLVGRCLHWQEPGGRPPCDWWGINVFSRTVLSGWLQPSHMPGEVMTDMSYPLSPETLYQAIKRSAGGAAVEAAGGRPAARSHATRAWPTPAVPAPSPPRPLPSPLPPRAPPCLVVWRLDLSHTGSGAVRRRSSAYGIPMYVTENGIADNKDDRRAAWIHGYFQQALRAVAEGYDVRGFFYYTLMVSASWPPGRAALPDASMMGVGDTGGHGASNGRGLLRLPAVPFTTLNPFAHLEALAPSRPRALTPLTPSPPHPDPGPDPGWPQDNFEWATGFTMKFGLFSWEPDGSKDRVLKEGAKALVRLYKTLPDSLPQLRKTLQAAQCPVDGPGEARTLPALA